MHIVKLITHVALSANEVIPGGINLVVDDVTGGHLLALAGGGTMMPLNDPRCAGHVGSDTLFTRAGGYGDLALLTPVLREHKRQFPDARIGVCTMNHYAPILAGLEYIDEIVKYPVTAEQAGDWKRWVFFENAIERNPLAATLHMTDLFASIAGLTMPDDGDKKPDYRVKASEAMWAMEQYPRLNGTKRVCIQPRTSARNRNYPGPLMGDIMGEFAVRRGWQTFIMGATGDVDLRQGKVPHNIRDMTGLTFRQSCAVLNIADVFVGCDSALLHVAGALGVPAVGIFGPFPWKLRTAYCPTTFAIQGSPMGPMCPCLHHTNAAKQDHFPSDCPTSARGYCGVLADIKPERVVAKAEQIAREYSHAL